MKVMVLGGAGFIGCNLASHHLRRGDEVRVVDDLSRRGASANLQWLQSSAAPGRLECVQCDIRDAERLGSLFDKRIERIYHMAGQVAVTCSVADPRHDFSVNALGTFNALECLRLRAPEAVFFYASTNKVYGEMTDIEVVEGPARYAYAQLPDGVPETRPLDFHSPYGCSKGCGDQYTMDYARIYGLRTVVFRQSCIYGTRQFGVEDQGWLAHFCIAAMLRRPLCIYGNGKQVRDVLWIDDLVDAFERAATHVDAIAGQAFNIGGGPAHAISVWHDLQPMLARYAGRPLPATFGDWRPGDQRIYISDVRKATRSFGWKPATGVEQGLERLWRWLAEQRETLPNLV